MKTSVKIRKADNDVKFNDFASNPDLVRYESIHDKWTEEEIEQAHAERLIESALATDDRELARQVVDHANDYLLAHGHGEIAGSMGVNVVRHDGELRDDEVAIIGRNSIFVVWDHYGVTPHDSRLIKAVEAGVASVVN